MAMYEEYEAFDDLEDEFLEKEEEYTAAVAGYVDEHIDLFATIVWFRVVFPPTDNAVRKKHETGRLVVPVGMTKC